MTKAKATSRRKSFGRPVKVEELEPVSFDLYDQEFECYRQIHGKALLTFVQEANSEDGERATKAMLGIFERVMPPDEYKRFEELCEDPETIVPVETLGEIIGWLMEVYTGRPTEPSKA